MQAALARDRTHSHRQRSFVIQPPPSSPRSTEGRRDHGLTAEGTPRTESKISSGMSIPDTTAAAVDGRAAPSPRGVVDLQRCSGRNAAQYAANGSSAIQSVPPSVAEYRDRLAAAMGGQVRVPIRSHDEEERLMEVYLDGDDARFCAGTLQGASRHRAKLIVRQRSYAAEGPLNVESARKYLAPHVPKLRLSTLTRNREAPSTTAADRASHRTRRLSTVTSNDERCLTGEGNQLLEQILDAAETCERRHALQQSRRATRLENRHKSEMLSKVEARKRMLEAASPTAASAGELSSRSQSCRVAMARTPGREAYISSVLQPSRSLTDQLIAAGGAGEGSAQIAAHVPSIQMKTAIPRPPLNSTNAASTLAYRPRDDYILRRPPSAIIL